MDLFKNVITQLRMVFYQFKLKWSQVQFTTFVSHSVFLRIYTMFEIPHNYPINKFFITFN